MVKLVDIFLFSNELDMLELRLTEHEQVDIFVIVESKKTFTNFDKELYFEKNSSRYSKWQNKIVYLVIDSFDENLKSSWDREYYSRNYALENIKNFLDDDSIILSSDLDEIINNELLKSLKVSQNVEYCLELAMFYYNFNWRLKNNWRYPVVINYKTIIEKYGNSLQELRLKSGGMRVILNAGWHLSYFLTYEEIQSKLKSFSHVEYSTKEYSCIENIKKSVENGSDLFGRPDVKLIKTNKLESLPINAKILPKMFQMDDYIFTNNWFGDQKFLHDKYLKEKYLECDGKINILEVGVHESNSTVYFSKYLSEPDSTITCIDPFLVSDQTSPVTEKTYEYCKHNIQLCGKSDQIKIIKDFSFNAMTKLYQENKKFHYLIVDGSHLSTDVLADAILAFNLAHPKGIIVFDDFRGGDIKSLKYPHIGLNCFLTCFANNIEVLHSDYHLVVRKL